MHGCWIIHEKLDDFTIYIYMKLLIRHHKIQTTQLSVSLLLSGDTQSSPKHFTAVPLDRGTIFFSEVI